MDIVEVIKKLKETRDNLKDVEKARDLAQDIDEAIEDLESHLEDGTQPDMVEVFTKIGKTFELISDLIPVPVVDQFIGAYGQAMQAAMTHADSWDTAGYRAYRDFRDDGATHQRAIQHTPARPDRETAEEWRRRYELKRLKERMEAQKEEQGRRDAGEPDDEASDAGQEGQPGFLSEMGSALGEVFNPVEAVRFYWRWIAGLLGVTGAQGETVDGQAFPLSGCLLPLALAVLFCGGLGGLYLWRGIDRSRSEETVVSRPEPVNFTDWDGDQIRDQEDNCPLVPNPAQHRAVGRGVGFACDDDPDGDGVPSIHDPNPVGPAEWSGETFPTLTLLNPGAIGDPLFEGPGLMEVIPFANQDPTGNDLLNMTVYPATSSPLGLPADGEFELVVEEAGFEAHLDCTQQPEIGTATCEGYARSEDDLASCWGTLDDQSFDVACHLPPGSAAQFAGAAENVNMRWMGDEGSREISWVARLPEGEVGPESLVDEGSDCLTPADERIPCAHAYADVESFNVDVGVDEAGEYVLTWMIETQAAIPTDGSVEVTLVQTLENSSTQERVPRFVYFYMTGNQWLYSGASLDGETTFSRFQLPEASVEVDENRIIIQQAVEGPVIPRVSWGGWLFDYEIEQADYAADEFPEGFFDGATPGWGIDFPNEPEARALLFTTPISSRVDAPFQMYSVRMFTEDEVGGLTHDCPYGNLDQMSPLEYIFWFRGRPEEEGSCATGTMFSSGDGSLTFGEPWSGPEVKDEPWVELQPGWNVVSMPDPAPSRPAHRSGAYVGSIAVESDPGGHGPFGWSLGEVQFDVAVEGGEINIGPVRGWNFIGPVGPDGGVTASGTGTFAGYGGIQGAFEGTFTQLTGLDGLITIGTDQGLPGGQPIQYSLMSNLTGAVISDTFDSSSGVGTRTVDLDEDGRADVRQEYDAEGNVIEELPLDRGDLVIGAVFDAESGMETKWVDTDGDGAADVVRRYGEDGSALGERALDGTVLGAEFDADSGVTSEWVDLDGDRQPDVIRRFDREGELIGEEEFGDGEVVAVSFSAATGTTTRWIDSDGDGSVDVVRLVDLESQVIEETEVDGGGIELIISESFDASTGTTAQLVDTDGDGLADVLRTFDSDGQAIEEVDLAATEGGVILDEDRDVESGTTTKSVDLDLDGDADVLQIYDENDELIEERQLDVDGEAVIIDESQDAETGVITRTVDVDRDGEADVERTYDENDVLIEERELRGPITEALGGIVPLALIAACLGALMSIGIAGAVLLLGLNWAWDSGPTREQMRKRVKDQLGQLETHQVRKIIQATRDQIKSWGRGGMIAEVIRDEADKVLELAEVDAISGDKEGAIQGYLDGLFVLEGLEGLAVFRVFLVESIQTFLLKTPGFLKGLQWVARYKKWSRIAEILKQLEKITDAADKAEKLRELKEEVEKIEAERLKHAPN